MDIYDKTIIEKVNVIRKRLRDEHGDAPSLRDPKLFEIMLDYWVSSKDAITKSQIRQLMEMLGEPWQSRHLKLVDKHAV